MLRSVLGAIVGYVAMVVVVMAGIGLAWVGLGAEGAFAGEEPHPSNLWMVSNLVGGFIAALAGGLVALKSGRSQRAVKILAGLVLGLGLVVALLAPSSEVSGKSLNKPVAELSFMEAGEYAQQPSWYNWLIPLVGVAGVLLGGRDRS